MYGEEATTLILMLTWSINNDLVGALVKGDAEELARRGIKTVVLYPSNVDHTFQVKGVTYCPVAITIRTNTNIVTNIVTALADFVRAISNLIHEAYDQRSFKAIYSYEWMGGLVGSFIKKYLNKPLITSICSIESMRSSEKSLLNLSIRGLEQRVLHQSDLVIARNITVIMRLLGEYEIPSDRTRLAMNAINAVDIIEEVIKADESINA